MTEPGQGLRFDVYERVQLPVDVADIQALEEIELTPHIGVYHENGQVILRGHLLLAGLYQGGEDDTAGERTLEHWIPVEISLPSSRVSEPERIEVAIDNFDVDLLAPRTLNITGVLSLRGVELRSDPAPQSWQEEPFTFTHTAEEAGIAEGYAYAATPDSDEDAPAAAERSRPAGQPEASVETDTDWGRPTVQPVAQAGGVQARAWAEAPRNDATAAMHDEGDLTADEEEPDTDIAAAEAGDVQLDAGQPADEQVEEQGGASIADAAPIKPEMKVGLSTHKEKSGDGGTAGLLTLLPRQRENEPAADIAAEFEPVIDAGLRNGIGTDDIQWRNLFLRSRGEDRDFRKVRMCIVQREDTLETIAGRYRLNARELQLHNRLDDETVREGQVLYIP